MNKITTSKKWFAWYPVKINFPDNVSCIVWFKFIYRTCLYKKGFFLRPIWQYSFAPIYVTKFNIGDLISFPIKDKGIYSELNDEDMESFRAQRRERRNSGKIK